MRSSVRLSIWESGTGVHCDHTVHDSGDLSLWLDSPMFWAPWHQSMFTYSLLPSIFPQFHLKERWGIDVHDRPISRTVEDSYYRVLTRSHVCRVGWHNTPEWPWMAVARIARYLCYSWASCFQRGASKCSSKDDNRWRASTARESDRRSSSISSKLLSQWLAVVVLMSVTDKASAADFWTNYYIVT